MLKIEDLEVSYGAVQALRGISMEVNDGEREQRPNQDKSKQQRPAPSHRARREYGEPRRRRFDQGVLR